MGVILVIRGADVGRIYTFGTYRPWRDHKALGGDGNNYPEMSGRILDLKQSKPAAITYFQGIVEPALEADFVVVVIPSSNPANTQSGLKTLVAKVTGKEGRVDASNCLLRTKKIAKLATGGSRSVAVHLSSVEVTDSNLIKDKRVLLLDDVKSTGNSLIACRKLLMDAGASVVQMAALAETGF